VVNSSLLPSSVSTSSKHPVLFCIPHAGGSALTYRAFVSEAPGWLEVCPIDLPGRGRLLNEPFALSLQALARRIAEAIFPLTDRPYAIFGHSMGALLAYEITAELAKTGHPQPRRLYVSGSRPPFLPRNKPPVDNLSDSAFLDHLRELQGTPEEVLGDRDVMQFFLPVLRSDFRMVEEYQPVDPPLLQIDVTALSGQQDEGAPKSDVRQWQRVTAGVFEFREYPGEHFFFSDRSVLRDVFDALGTC